MKNQVETLAWDSSFFGYKVGKCDLSSATGEEIRFLLASPEINDYRLVYFFLNRGDSTLEFMLESFPELKFVDTKRVYERKILTSDETIVSSGRCLSKGNEFLRQLEGLALESGLYSRFHTDVNFVNKEFERLYLEWIKQSLNREIAHEVFVSIDHDRVQGFVSLARKKFEAEIGLIAVDQEIRAGGIGSDLVCHAIKKAWEWNCLSIRVATQKANKTACRFYEKHGFSLHREINIYHMWNMNKRD